MPTRASRPKSTDVNRNAFLTVMRATGIEPAPEKNPAAVALGLLGATKGDKARAAQLSPMRRKAIARKAAAARWSRKPQN